MSTETLTPVNELRAAAKKIRESGRPVYFAGGVDVTAAVLEWLESWAKFFDRDLAMARRSDVFIDLDDVTELAEPVFVFARAINGSVA